jgi:steroid 5-alpha reductase family enzyme
MNAILISGYGVVTLLLIALYAIQRRTGNAAIADAGWTGGLLLLTVWYAVGAATPNLRTAVIATLAGLWALRLTHHILFYRVIRKPEDNRYRAMREYWGDTAQRNFFLFFQGQTVVAFLFSLPILAALTAPRTEWLLWDTLGVLIWLTAVSGEAVADHQLEQFRGHPGNKGKTCRYGLWRYSRHPNYFFEWIHWFAYVAFAAGHPAWAATWLGPVVMLIFLLKFTGIPYSEKQALKSRGDDYRAYQNTTSLFIPWPPKKERI